MSRRPLHIGMPSAPPSVFSDQVTAPRQRSIDEAEDRVGTASKISRWVDVPSFIDRVIIGRTPDPDESKTTLVIDLPFLTVSHSHLELRWYKAWGDWKDCWVIRDLGSTNGTRLDDIMRRQVAIGAAGEPITDGINTKLTLGDTVILVYEQ